MSEFLSFFVTAPHNMWDLSSPETEPTSPAVGARGQPLDHLGSHKMSKL